MAVKPWQGIRPGASRVDVYNEALLVFLFDESQLPVIQSSGADLETGYAETDAEIDKPLKKLAKNGILVAYELIQDDAVTVEVVVGPPLTKAELAAARWLKPQTAALKLPSGVLRVDTGNTLPMDEETDEQPEEEPGRVTVPPGDYVLSLYRLDWERLKGDGLLDDGEEWPGPQEVVVLTPSADAKPVKGSKPLLRFPSPATGAWRGKYEIADGVFRGKAIAWDKRIGCSVNVDRRAAEGLGLTPGVGLRVEVGDLVLEAVFVGEADPLWAKPKWLHPLRGDRREFGAAYRALGTDDLDHALFIDRVVNSRDFPELKTWLPAIVTVLAERFPVPGVPPAPAPAPDGGDVDADDIAEIGEMFEE